MLKSIESWCLMFQEDLLKWYQNNYRKLPWRVDCNPYKIWLSEIMLQQTQVKTVIDYYNRFIDQYPTVSDLSKADEHDVLKLWEGLGYYSRARRLIPCAQMIVEDYQGKFPTDYKEIIKLPGIGSYTAGAVLSIAFNAKLPAVDGNVMRVYARLFDLSWDISIPKTKSKFEKKVLETLPMNRRDFNQALMELGAMICKPKNPECINCPIKDHCKAYLNGSEKALPVKSKKIKKKHAKKAVLYIVHKEELLLIKRPSKGLLAGLWGFPVIDMEDDIETNLCHHLLNDLGLSYVVHEQVKTGKHVFTHLIWEMTLLKVQVKDKAYIDYPEIVWIKEDEIKNYPVPTAFRKLL